MLKMLKMLKMDIFKRSSVQEKIQRLKERKVTYTHLLDNLEARGENQVSLTDPQSGDA